MEVVYYKKKVESLLLLLRKKWKGRGEAHELSRRRSVAACSLQQQILHGGSLSGPCGDEERGPAVPMHGRLAVGPIF